MMDCMMDKAFSPRLEDVEKDVEKNCMNCSCQEECLKEYINR